MEQKPSLSKFLVIKIIYNPKNPQFPTFFNKLNIKYILKQYYQSLYEVHIYKGEFKNSEWSGQGTLVFPDGSTYEGEWSKGFMNGQGTFTWADGKQKSGIWKNGKLQE